MYASFVRQRVNVAPRGVELRDGDALEPAHEPALRPRSTISAGLPSVALFLRGDSGSSFPRRGVVGAVSRILPRCWLRPRALSHGVCGRAVKAAPTIVIQAVPAVFLLVSLRTDARRGVDDWADYCYGLEYRNGRQPSSSLLPPTTARPARRDVGSETVCEREVPPSTL